MSIKCFNDRKDILRVFTPLPTIAVMTYKKGYALRLQWLWYGILIYFRKPVI